MNLRSSLYVDICLSSFSVVLILLSLFTEYFSILPLEIGRFLGVKNLAIYLDSIHFVLVFVALLLIFQTITFIRVLDSSPTLSSVVVNFYLIKWVLITLTNVFPYTYNLKPPIIFLVLNIFMSMLFYFQKLIKN